MKGTSKRFACTYPGCTKSFNRHDYLDRHAANHLVVKPYYCRHCARHFSRKDLYENHMNTRFHAKRVEELAQSRAAHAESAAAETRIARIKQAYPKAIAAGAGAGDSGPESPGGDDGSMSTPTSPATILAPTATELEQPLLPLSGTGGYSSSHFPKDFFKDFSPDLSKDFSKEFSKNLPKDFKDYTSDFTQEYPHDMVPEFHGVNFLNSRLTPSIVADYPKPNDGLLTLVDYQDSDTFENRRRGSLLYGLQREPQEPLHFARWSQYDPMGHNAFHPVGLDTTSTTASASATETTASSPTVIRPCAAMPMRDFLLDSAPADHSSTMSSSETKTSFHSGTTVSSGSSNPTSVSDTQSPQLGRQTYGPYRLMNVPPTQYRPSSHEYSQTLFEPYVAAAQHLQSVKTDTIAFQDTEKLQRLLREPPPGALFAENFNNQFLWFFNNHFGTPSAKVGYDNCYAQTNREYQQRANKYEDDHSKQQRLNPEYRPLDETASYMVLRILKDAPRELFEDTTMIDYYMHIAWRQTSAVHYIVHLPTFDPSHCHPTLLSTLVIMGMSISGDPQARLASKTLYPSVLTATYESVLDAAAGSGVDRHAVPDIGQLQAFTLLMRYEQLILGSDVARLSLLHGPTSSAMIDRFLWVLLSYVHHWNGPQTPIWSLGVNQKPLWATVGPESYSFHANCMPKLQWREWARYEMAKRTFHLALFCDNMHCLSAGSENLRPVSIFNMDTHMICHEWLWDAWSESEFFQIVGPTRVIPCVPYLGLIKSLIRFPRVPSTAANQRRRAETERPRGTPPLWSLFSLRVLAYGLTNIVGRLSGVSEHGEQLAEQIFNSDYMMGSKEPPMAMASPLVSPLFDRSIQSRLFRGLDLWLQYFEDTYGKVTERIFEISGSSDASTSASQHMPQINEDLAMLDLDNASEGIPGYVFVVVFYHYSSFLFVHEDLPIVLQVVSNLKTWLDMPTPIPYATLLNKLCIPLYVQWLQSNEALAMVSTSALCLVWLNASMGRLPAKLFNQFLLSATFISVMVLWLHDLTRSAGVTTSPDEQLPPVELENYKFVSEAMSFVQAVATNTHANVGKMATSPLGTRFNQDFDTPGDKIRDVILLAECMLFSRPNSERLVGFLMRLLVVIDPRLTIPIQQTVLRGSRQFFASRHA